MFYVLIQNGKAISASTEYPGNNVKWSRDGLSDGYTNRNDWPTMADAERMAEALNEVTGFQRFVATDAGPNCSPRYDICEIPKVGDEVSYTFNGDYYPDGKIVSISKSLKVIKTDSGRAYYRRKLTGAWVNNGTWSLVAGHHYKLNPSF